nr:hypothetical protein [Tanacetum cinerariifolium]
MYVPKKNPVRTNIGLRMNRGPRRVVDGVVQPIAPTTTEQRLVKKNKLKSTEEGIDYEEVFAPVARIKAIRLFLAYASFMGFMVYQMDVKSAFLYETIEEEVYVCQPLRFEDPDYPDKVYVDDIIFGSTNKELCKAFEKLMKDKFQMSSMGGLTFFLRLQVKKKDNGIFISQGKYIAEILRKFGLIYRKSASTPIDTEKPLLKDLDGEDVDVHTHKSMIGSLMYLTSFRLDIITPQRNGVVERRNRTLVKAARTMLTFTNLPLFLWDEAIATACFTQNHSIIHKRFDKTPYELMNKRKPNIKFVRVFRCRCYLLNDYDDVGKLKAKGDIGVFVGYSKESVAFRIYNKRTHKIHESVNVNFDEISDMASKQIRNFKEDLFQNFYDEYFDSSKIMKSSTMNVETSNVEIPSNKEEVFHESSKSFQEESSSSSLNDDVHQSLEEVAVPSLNTQLVLNNMVPNVDEASTSHNVFNERLEDAYFDSSTSFHDPSNVHTFYQPYPHEKKWTKDYPLHKIIGDPKSSVSVMQEELDQFTRLKVWILVPRPEGKTIIKTKWIFKNKKDESSLVIRNKARLIVVGYSQQKGIDYDETFAPEEVYVGQPSGFVSKQHPYHAYALDKALYRLIQAPRAWYDVLSLFLIDSGFQKGSIDTTLFIKKKGKHIMLIQIYVDDIIFGSTNPEYYTKFSYLMVKHFEMSMMGEMKFFLGLQVNQFSDGIFKNQSKYILDILKIFGMENCDTVPTPIVEQAKLKLDLVKKPVDHTDYRSMIGLLMYVTSSRPDIMFATCMCARYQTNPNEHHVSAVKRIFRYLKRTINLGLWYPKDSGFDLTAYSNADHAGYHLDRKSTSGSV